MITTTTTSQEGANQMVSVFLQPSDRMTAPELREYLATRYGEVDADTRTRAAEMMSEFGADVIEVEGYIIPVAVATELFRQKRFETILAIVRSWGAEYAREYVGYTPRAEREDLGEMPSAEYSDMQYTFPGGTDEEYDAYAHAYVYSFNDTLRGLRVAEGAR
jgi:hypothetical protein